LAGRTLLDGVLSVNVDLSTGPDGALAASIANQKIPDKALSGMLGGELQARNTEIPHYKQLLDDLAVGLIDQVNSVHSSGYDANGNAGTELFTGTSATNIRLAANMKNAPFKLAVSQNVDGTDGYIAQRLADLRETPASGEHSLSFQYAALVSELGSNSSSLKVSRDNNQALVDYAEARTEAVSGVSLDEELTDIIRYQQAYSAAARVLTSIDEALDILINRTGQVGR
jgi:flagellar hook-associated protein 1 FlgK